jgi:hypothetical protein
MSDDKIHNLDLRVTILEQITKDISNTLVRIEGKLDRTEERLEGKLDWAEGRLEGRLDRIEGRLDQWSDQHWRNFRWLLGIVLGGFVGLLATMAHGFKWL